jgi:pimeloyl-ACP methyl ester carboxylesterase
VLAACAPAGHESATRDDSAFNALFRHEFHDVDGVRMHLVSGGTGSVLVLVHGWPETWWGWRKVMPMLAERYQVIAVDLPGLGDSEGQPTSYDKLTLATYLHRLIADELGHERIFLAGHDWGGAVAFQYADQYPSEVVSLAVLELLLPGFRPDELFDEDPTEESFHFAFHMAPRFPELLVAGREREYLDAFIEMSSVRKGAVTAADVDEYARTYAEPDKLRAGFELYRSLRTDADDNLASVRRRRLPMQVLAIGGGAASGPAVAGSLRPATDDLSDVVVVDAGHWLIHEEPDQVAAELLEFFGAA